MLCGDLFIDESIQIEDDSLEVNDQNLRSFAYSCFLGYIHFLVTEIAVVVIDKFSQNESVE